MWPSTQAISPVPFSLHTFLVILTVLVASLAVLLHLIRLYTRSRRRTRLREFARTVGATRSNQLPDFLQGSDVRFRVLVGFSAPDLVMLHFKSDHTPGSRKPNAASLFSLVAVRHTADPLFAALRPESARVSLVDLFSVSGARPPMAPDSAVRLLSYPSLPAGGTRSDQFTLFAVSDGDAKLAARAELTTLLPPDLGLLIRHDWVILETSSREFEELSLRPAVTLARQLASAVSCLRDLPPTSSHLP